MRRKILLGLGIVILVAGIALFLGREKLAERAFDSVLENNVGVDQSLALGDGLHAYICGTGSPMPDNDRAGPCIAVLAGREAFVFDAGSGSIRKLQRMGFPIDRLRGVYLTHLHSDHIDGMGELLLQAWVGGGRSAPLPVHGPAGTDKVVAGLMQAYEIDKGYRVTHHGPEAVRPAGFGGAAQIIAMPDGETSRLVYDQDGIRITAFLVDHAPISPAYGYRVDYRGRSIAISGDTIYSPNLVTASKGVDVLFHEALNKDMIAAISKKLGERGRKDSAKIMADILDYHASPADAARAAREAGAKTLVLYHVVPPVPAKAIEPLFLGGADAEYSGPLKLAHDGMLVSLPAGSSEVKFLEGF